MKDAIFNTSSYYSSASWCCDLTLLDIYNCVTELFSQSNHSWPSLLYRCIWIKPHQQHLYWYVSTGDAYPVLLMTYSIVYILLYTVEFLTVDQVLDLKPLPEWSNPNSPEYYYFLQNFTQTIQPLFNTSSSGGGDDGGSYVGNIILNVTQ